MAGNFTSLLLDIDIDLFSGSWFEKCKEFVKFPKLSVGRVAITYSLLLKLDVSKYMTLGILQVIKMEHLHYIYHPCRVLWNLDCNY